ncbi:MAG: NADPH:quinone reductase [Pseudomonadota bacterium]
MIGASYSARGPAREVLQVGELPEPTAAPGEVLVRVHASGANPSDVKTRAGNMGPMTVERTVPHSDGAGVIEAVGQGVCERRVGERVWLYNVNRTADGQGQGARGTAAELVAVGADLAVPLANGVSFEEGACLGVPAMTAHRALFADGPIEGMSLLITGGAGAVGSMAIQMAKAAGARVVTTVSGDEKAAATREDGADTVVNYKTENLVEAVLTANGGKKLDRIVDVDFGSHVNLTPEILKPNGMIAAYASMGAPQPSLQYYPLMFNNTVIRLVFVYAMPAEATGAAGLAVDQMLRSGALKPRVAQTFALADIAAAHEMVEGGRQIGNVIVTI